MNLEKMFAEVITSKYLTVFFMRTFATNKHHLNLTILRQIVECLEFVSGIS